MRPTRPWLQIAGIALLSVLLVTVTYLAEGPGEMNDFEVFHRAGARFLHGESLYQPRDGHFMFKYLPGSAAVFAIFSVLPLDVAKVAWCIVEAISLSYTFVSLGKLLSSPQRGPLLTVLPAFVILARCHEREIAHGQANLEMVALLVASAAALAKGSEVGSGFLAALATFIKPYAAIIAIYYLLIRRFRALAILSAGLGVLLLLPAARYGVQGTFRLHADLASSVSASTDRLLDYPSNISLLGMYSKWFGPSGHGVRLLAFATWCACTIPAAIEIRRSWTNEPYITLVDYGFFMCMITLSSPQGWDYTLLNASPLVVVITKDWGAFPAWAKWCLGVLLAIVAVDYKVLLDPALYIKWSRVSAPTWTALGLIVASAHLRARALKPHPAALP